MTNTRIKRSALVPATLILSAGAVSSVNAQSVSYQELYTFIGDGEGDRLGFFVSGAGDVNGDGFDDLIVGAPFDDPNGSNSGSARVFSGASGSVLFTFYGDSSNDQFGMAVSAAGDVNGDGFADLIVGARYDDNNGSNSGSVRVFSGANGSVLFTLNGDSAADQFGHSVACAGDVNGDGFDDVVVGTRYDDNNGTNSGNAKVFSGLDGSLLLSFNGDSASVWFGYSVSGSGDVNGDGYSDIVVGASREGAGTARVFSGVDGSVLFVVQGDSLGDAFGWSVSCAGDINGDGLDDLIVGAPYDDDNGISAGSARVFSGADGSTLHTVRGTNFGGKLGFSVSGAGDVNGDGLGDFVVGAPYDSSISPSAGIALVYSGMDGSVIFRFDGKNSVDLFGRAVSRAGDVNGDGFEDLIVGALGDDTNGFNCGSAKIYMSYVTLPERLCADQNKDGLVTPADFSSWIANFNAMSLLADVNQDTFVTPADFSAWVAAFNQGVNGPTCVP